MNNRTKLRAWLHDPLPRDVRAALERLARIEDVAVVAAMPDVHLAKEVCVGTVLGTQSKLFPDAVGGDIGCGMAALSFDVSAEVLEDPISAARILSALRKVVPTSNHPSHGAVVPTILNNRNLSESSLERKKASIGRMQLGTLGRGNHFVEFQRDEVNGLWLMIHSGSRGMGQAIREHHCGSDAALTSLAADSREGKAYLRDLDWALAYAKQNRRRMSEAVATMVQELLRVSPDWESYFDCHHNFVRQELHQGQKLWVHRKGAISAMAGERGIIPGSMGSPSFHVSGRGDPESLCSSSHGAGRLMSRTDARKKITAKTLSKQMRGVWFDHRIARRLRDEAPGAYKDIGAVMRAQRKLTRVVRKLQPVLVYKGI